ncbi:MauE/DoxX family redox-associated membrane protein [Actinomadura luteofluorescens]|uniref:MauE/DoxX family redox-associated membrane protein n=1 Tax=Actinomadura luteofluorescens TaxID=46163 RepID=UPI0036452004
MTVGLGIGEGMLGLALLVTSHLSVRLATTVAFAAATWVVGELRVHRPDAGCGCFGALSAKKVDRRSVLRAMLFTCAAIVSLGAPHAGVDVLRDVPAQVGLMFAVEVALFVALSPELAELAAGTGARAPPSRASGGRARCRRPTRGCTTARRGPSTRTRSRPRCRWTCGGRAAGGSWPSPDG